MDRRGFIARAAGVVVLGLLPLKRLFRDSLEAAQIVKIILKLE